MADATLDHERIRAHYARAMPWLLRHFGGTPVVRVAYPNGPEGDPIFHKDLFGAPPDVATIEVRTSTGLHRYARLDARAVHWMCAAENVVELDGWSPMLDDPDRAMFGRIILAPSGTATDDDVRQAAHLAREALKTQQLDAIFMLDGFRGASLWIPFEDGPAYGQLGPWLHDFAATLAAQHPVLMTTAALRAERGNRVYLGTKSNHPGMGSLLPYALRGTPSLEVSIPVPWNDLTTVHNGTVTAADFPEYERLFGDVFARLRSSIGPQTFGKREVRHRTPEIAMLLAAPEPMPKGYVIAAALAVLADEKTHDADDILAQALARKLLPPSTTRKYVYTALHEYVVRTLGMGKTPELVQIDGTSQFRLNEPADVWPAIALPALPSWLTTENIASISERLRTTATGDDPAAFEVAACDAFAALGFLATHIGGNAAPDGVLTAPLGTDGYRIVLECKTASPGAIVTNPRPEEPAKFRAAANAQYALLLGPAFGNDASFDDELTQHAVTCCTVDDLVRALEAEVGPDEFRPALVSGRAEAALSALFWERAHDRRKRVEVIAQYAACAGWELQCTLARGVPSAQTPALTQETLFALVDQELVRQGVTAGAALDEAQEALRLLETRHLLREATNGYVVRQPA